MYYKQSAHNQCCDTSHDDKYYTHLIHSGTMPMYTFLPHNIFCASVTENTHHDRRHKPSDTDSTPSSTDLQEYVTDRHYIHATDYNMYPSSMQVEQNTRAYQLLDVTLPIIKRRRFDRLAADEGEQMYLLLRSYRKTHGLEDAYLDRIITLSKEIGLLYPDYLRRRCEKFTPLTQTELHVLTLIADGRSNVQIADYLDISVNTVKFHCKNIFQKLDATNRQQAIKTAQELKLLRK